MTGKPAIDGYDVRYKKSDDSTWTMHKFSGVVTATRGSDGTTASVSWTEYDGSDFDYYKVIVCTADNFHSSGPSCVSPLFQGSAIYTSTNTTQAVTGLTQPRATASSCNCGLTAERTRNSTSKWRPTPTTPPSEEHRPSTPPARTSTA